jgi:hypothetical protein
MGSNGKKNDVEKYTVTDILFYGALLFTVIITLLLVLDIWF